MDIVTYEPHLLKSYFQPIVDNQLKLQTQIMKVTLSLNHDQESSATSKANLITLFNRESNASTSIESYSLCYQRQEIARLHITYKHSAMPNTNERKNSLKPLEELIRKMSLLLKRYQTSHLISKTLGRSLEITGYSSKILELDAFIEKAAIFDFPVIITGEQGTEKFSVACAIHYNSKFKDKPFIEFNSTSPDITHFENNLNLCFQRAQGGTVFLSHLDKISPAQQTQLLKYLVTSSQNSNSLTRLIASSTCSLTELVGKGEFCPQLYNLLNYLTVSVPVISQRIEDIPHIIQSVKNQNKLFEDQELSPKTQNVLYNYDWPGNYQEVEQVITRLLTLSPSNPIEPEELQRFAPNVFNSPHNYDNRASEQFDIINCLKNKNFNLLAHLHRGLQVALTFIANNYTLELNLKLVSDQAFVSPSHLSFLFKQHIGKTVKQIIVELRVFKAKEIIDREPFVRITDLALKVGFKDVSDFEKMFRRYIHLTPREYKAQMHGRPPRSN